jgi:hypothetical protein
MAEQSKHINYSFEDIQRYLNGKMSAVEMHDLEKAALQDPFLADAIEGYTASDLTTAKQHLNEINAGITGKRERSKIISFNKTTRWLNVAAMLLIVTGIGVFGFYFLKNTDNKQEVAEVKKGSVRNQSLADSTTGNINNINTLSKQKDTTLTIAQNKKLQPPVLRPSSKKQNVNSLASPGREVQADTIRPAMMAASPLNQQNETASASPANADMAFKKSDSVQPLLQGKTSGVSIAANIFTGKVVDENNKPIAGAFIESADKKTAAVTDVNGDFSLQKNDSLLKVVASNIGYESKAMPLQPGQDNVIMLKTSNASLSEVTVVGYNAPKRTGLASQAAMPVGGWQNFNKYVMNRLNKDTTAKAITNPDDLVEIEFLIDKTGNPYDFKITKSLDDQRNAKAIEILQNGPKWTTTSKNKKAKVAINF